MDIEKININNWIRRKVNELENMIRVTFLNQKGQAKYINETLLQLWGFDILIKFI